MAGHTTPTSAEGPEGIEELGPSLRVADYMSPQVRTVAATAPLRDAARLLAAHEISCLVVFDGTTMVGVVTERDLVRTVAAAPTTWADQPVTDAMTHPLHVTDSGTSVADAIAALRRHRIRRLPVVSAEGQLAGIVSQTDLLRAAHRGLRDYAVDLERVVTARTAELLASERRRGDLVDLTVHDIKNSLSVVESAVEMIEIDVT